MEAPKGDKFSKSLIIKRHSRDMYRQVPCTPYSVHSKSRSGGLSESINILAVSAPYSWVMTSGTTRFFLDLLIFSERPTCTGLLSENLKACPFSLMPTS